MYRHSFFKTVYESRDGDVWYLRVPNLYIFFLSVKRDRYYILRLSRQDKSTIGMKEGGGN